MFKHLLFYFITLFPFMSFALGDFAPQLSMRCINGTNVYERIETASRLGFQGVEYNKYIKLSVKEQENITDLLEKQKLTLFLSVFSLDYNRYTVQPKYGLSQLKTEIEVECDWVIDAWSIGKFQYVTIVPGLRTISISKEEQFKRSVEITQFVADYFKKKNCPIILVIEAINRNEGTKLIQTQEESYNFCKAVNRDNVKMLFDFYHAGMNNEDYLSDVIKYKDMIGYFQIGDVPGRCEVGSGKMNYKKVFELIDSEPCLRNIPIGMEHNQTCTNEDLANIYLKSNK